jgi:hypothetical protein
MSLIPVAFELTDQYGLNIDNPSLCPILAATQELGLPVTTVGYLRQDVRTVSDPTKIKGMSGSCYTQEGWLSRGTNHCLVPAKQGLAGGRLVLEGEQWISRDMEEQSYFLVHCTPEQLLALLTSLKGIAGKLVADSFRYSDPAILTLTVVE